MTKNKIITCFTVMLTIILSVVFIMSNVKGLSKQDLQNIIDNPPTQTSEIDKAYRVIGDYYNELKTDNIVAGLDLEEANLFIEATNVLINQIQVQIDRCLALYERYNSEVYLYQSEYYKSQKSEVEGYLDSINTIIDNVQLDSNELTEIKETTTSNQSEIQKRYEILRKWYNEYVSKWVIEPKKDVSDLRLYCEAIDKLLQYGKGNLTENQKFFLERWKTTAEGIIQDQGEAVEGSTSTGDEDYNEKKPTFRLEVGMDIPYVGYKNDNGYIVPTSVEINGVRFHMYCIDHGSTPGSRLRTKNLLNEDWNKDWKVGDTEEYHPSSYCSKPLGEKKNTTAVFYELPKFKIGQKYDITTPQYDKYQYVGYILHHLKNRPETSDTASWLAQNALWATSINGGNGNLDNSIDDFQSKPAAIEQSAIINELNNEERTIVLNAALDVQTMSDVPSVIAKLNYLINHYKEKANNSASAEMITFYKGLAEYEESAIRWIQDPNISKTLSDIRANVYQYLVQIEDGPESIEEKLRKKAEELTAELLISGEDSDTLSNAGALVSEALAYQSFYEELKDNKGVLKVENKTGITETYIDRINNKYTVGPFKIQYNDKYVKSSADTKNRINFAEIVAIKIYNEKNELYKTYCIDHTDANGNNIPAKREFEITKNPTVWKVDDGYAFPKNNEEFYVVFTGDKSPSGVTIDPSRITVEVEFRYIAYYIAELYKTEYATQSSYQWKAQSISHSNNCILESCTGHTCSAIRYTFTGIDTVRLQYQLLVGMTEEAIETTSIRMPAFRLIIRDDDKDEDHYDEVTMEVSGRVFWDQSSGKQTLPDGLYSHDEPLLKNIKVSLYEYNEETGESVLATLAKAKTDETTGKTEIRTNPTVTNEKGEYIFYGVRPMSKYYVQFEYNGQIYQATTFTSQTEEMSENTGQEGNEKDEQTLGRISVAKEYQTEQDKQNAKVSTATARETYNAKFSTIGSAPRNYKSTNSLGYNVIGRTYTQKELMGYKLVNGGNGVYSYQVDDSVVQLLDEVTTDGTLREGIISKKINEYIYGVGGTLKNPTDGAHGAYPDLKTDIYDKIISEYESKDPEIKDKLQYIEDIKMTADTTNGQLKTSKEVLSLLSKYDRFTIGKNECVIKKGDFVLMGIDGKAIDWVESVSTTNQGNTTITYHNLYAEQNNINLGLNERPTTDMALRSDVKEVTLEINGKSHVYDYDTRKASDESDGASDTWEIGVRLSDAYYDTEYSREIYKSDYLYKTSNYNNEAHGADYYGKDKSDELEVYVTYKLTLRNQSLSVLTSIDEIVDYFDEDYEYVPERSYYQIGRTGGRKAVVADLGSSSYADDTKTTIPGYESLYIKGLKGEYLKSGQTAYIYLTFRVEKDTINNEDWIKIDEDEVTGEDIGVGKENLAEINGYSTIYADGVEVPNVQGSVQGKPAGITDYDSDPGNLEAQAVPKDGDVDFMSFEDDTDKAPNIKIVLYRNHDREIQGLVWEDARTENVTVNGTTTESGARIGDGLMQDGETKINGVTVQLVELMDNGTEFIWKTFENGSGVATLNSENMKVTPPILTAGKSGNIVQDYVFGNATADISGQYAFKSFAPGNYVVRFIYGDTVKTVLVNSGLASSTDENTSKAAQITQQLKALYGEGIDGLNAKSYNGQDYKSTTYQEQISQNGVLEIREDPTIELNIKTFSEDSIKTIRAYNKDASNQNESGTYYYDIAASDARADVSDAKDIYTNGTMALKDGANNMKQAIGSLNTRTDVIGYSNKDLLNRIAEILASYRERPEYEDATNNNTPVSYTNEELKALVDELISKTQMTAETGVMDIELEYNIPSSSYEAESTDSYILRNVNLGLEERPKSQLKIEKEITNIKVTLSDDTVLFDTDKMATNVLWQQHRDYSVGYKDNLLNLSGIEQIRRDNQNKFGIVQLSMDEEIMHGATIQLTYEISVANVGEVDYADTRFYYTGAVNDVSKVVKTTANQVIDYVANNLQFNKEDAKNKEGGWEYIKAEDLLSRNLVNSRLEPQIKEYNTIITTGALSAPLVPAKYYEAIKSGEMEVSIPLILTQLVSPENEADDLSYRNIVEIVRTSNDVGRKNEYSVVGNQDPRLQAKELDSDLSEDTKILPPFGAQPTYYVLWTVVAVVLALGIAFITFKVIRKRTK